MPSSLLSMEGAARCAAASSTFTLGVLCVFVAVIGCGVNQPSATLEDYGHAATQPVEAIVVDPSKTWVPQEEVRTLTAAAAESPEGFVEIPLDAPWVAQPNATAELHLSADEVLQLKANLSHADDYAEVFLDLSSVSLPDLKSNSSGAYNLVGMQVLALVHGDDHFVGPPKTPNGIQISIKDDEWNTEVGRWINATSAFADETMVVYMEVPDTPLGRNVRGLTVKFSLNSEAMIGFCGHLNITSLRIKPASR